MGKLDAKVALITGAGCGIGRASAILFAREGAGVVVGEYVAETGEDTVRMIEQVDGRRSFRG